MRRLSTSYEEIIAHESADAQAGEPTVQCAPAGRHNSMAGKLQLLFIFWFVHMKI